MNIILSGAMPIISCFLDLLIMLHLFSLPQGLEPISNNERVFHKRSVSLSSTGSKSHCRRRWFEGFVHILCITEASFCLWYDFPADRLFEHTSLGGYFFTLFRRSFLSSKHILSQPI